MYRALLDADGSRALYVPLNHPDFDIVLEGLRDLQQLEFIIDRVGVTFGTALSDQNEFQELSKKFYTGLATDSMTLSRLP